MENTGERYLPSINGEIRYEHLHRYAVCLSLVRNKTVLDIASGEGYGSALLAGSAHEIIGVDIDSKAIEYASEKYGEIQNLKFLLGNCESIPIKNNSVDVVTSFETIEHHDKHKEMISEVKRVLKPDGLLIISSPNKQTYSDETGHKNPFHVRELYYEQFKELLESYFDNVVIYGQRLAVGSFVFNLSISQSLNVERFTSLDDKITQDLIPLKSPVYFIALCTDNKDKVGSSIDSIYIDRDDDILRELINNLRNLQRSHLEAEARASDLYNQVYQYQRSKFWKMRNIWMNIRKLLS